MGPGETAGIVVVTVAFIQGLIAFAKFVINKFADKEDAKVQDDIRDKLDDIEVKCGLTERQAEELKVLHDLHNVKDLDGAPLWYVPRSWAGTQKEIVDKLIVITETQSKILSIIERIERRQESLN